MDAATLERRLLALLDSMTGRLPADQLDSMRDLVRHNESGIALENLCTQLTEFDQSIPRSQLDELVALGSAMRIDPSTWGDLQISA